jgi:hypothetical protein
MEVKELTGKTVKVCQSSITAKDEGKTCGIVKGITVYGKAQARTKFDFKAKAKTAWMHGQSNNVIIDGQEVYFLYDESKDELAKMLVENGLTEYQREIDERAKMLDGIKADGATVIYCKKILA